MNLSQPISRALSRGFSQRLGGRGTAAPAGFSLRAAGNGGGKAVLNWSGFNLNAVDPLGYWVYEWSVNSDMSGANSDILGNPLVKTTEIEIDDPTNDYYFRVSGYDSGDVLLKQTQIVGPKPIPGYTDVAAFIEALEAESRTVTQLEREALYDDKTRGLAAGHYTKLYDRVWFGWANANANRVRQKALTKIPAFTAPAAHNAGHVDFAGGGCGKVWSPADAFSSVDSIGNLIGTVGSRAVGSSIDFGVRNAANTNNLDLFYGYTLAVASFGNNGTARITAAAATMPEGFYLANRISGNAQLRSYIAGTLATPASGAVSGGALSTHMMAIGGYALDSSSVDNQTGHKYSQVASYNGLTNTERDDALIDALTTEIALGWRTAP
jgi:hypothetical protein